MPLPSLGTSGNSNGVSRGPSVATTLPSSPAQRSDQHQHDVHPYSETFALHYHSAITVPHTSAGLGERAFPERGQFRKHFLRSGHSVTNGPAARWTRTDVMTCRFAFLSIVVRTFALAGDTCASQRRLSCSWASASCSSVTPEGMTHGGGGVPVHAGALQCVVRLSHRIRSPAWHCTSNGLFPRARIGSSCGSIDLCTHGSIGQLYRRNAEEVPRVTRFDALNERCVVSV